MNRGNPRTDWLSLETTGLSFELCIQVGSTVYVAPLRPNAGMAIDEKGIGESLEQQNQKPDPLFPLCSMQRIENEEGHYGNRTAPNKSPHPQYDEITVDNM
jgi:hypothetical protein